MLGDVAVCEHGELDGVAGEGAFVVVLVLVDLVVELGLGFGDEGDVAAGDVAFLDGSRRLEE